MNRIRASKCEIVIMSKQTESHFLNLYHKQKSIDSDICYGLTYNGELVQIMSFGRPRIEAQNNIIWHDWEMLRECSKSDYQVLGGKSKLLKHFENIHKPINLLSYCNTTEGFDGHSYIACGFKLERTSLDYYYTYNGEIIKRYRMQKNSNMRNKGQKEPIQRTLEKFGKNYDYKLTELENAERAGFIKVEGTGQQVWSKCNYNNYGVIYETRNTQTNETYIGQHIIMQNGIYNKNLEYYGSGVYISRAVKSLGKRAFKVRPIIWTTDLNKLTELEYKYINEYKAQGKAEYNIATNPYNAAAHCYQNNKPNNSESLKKYYETHESPNKGRKMSIETRIKMSESRISKQQPQLHTPEAIMKTLSSDGYRNRAPRCKESYTDEWKNLIKVNTKDAMVRVKQECIDYIHNLGYITREDIMKQLNISYKQSCKFKPVGKYKKVNYYNPL